MSKLIYNFDYEISIFTKIDKDRTKIVDFLRMKIFWVCLTFFDSHFMQCASDIHVQRDRIVHSL